MLSVLFLFAGVAILFSFLCSLWESVLLSITPSYAHLQESQGTSIGRRLTSFKANIDRPLAAILTLNTIAHTVGAIGVGEQASHIWSATNPLITQLLVPAVMTLAVLILSEIIPKTVGANYWKELAPFTVHSLTILIRIMAPLIWLSEGVTRSLRKDHSGSMFSRTEFMAMAEAGAKEGVFDPSESEIIQNLLRFNKVLARDIMTPRTVTFMVPESMTVQEFFDSRPLQRFTRIPLYSDARGDNVVGYVRKDQVLRRMADGGGEETLESLRRDILVIDRDYPIPRLFNHFLERREHIALVVNEFGGMSGIVTLEDVIETMLGLEIVDELDRSEDMQALARRNWEMRARSLGILQPDEETPENGTTESETSP